MSIRNRLVLVFFSTALLALSAAADFAYKAELTISGYSGSTTLQNFPVLVRLSPDRIDGFKYTLCQADGKDLKFTSPDGETVYPHEIDTWNPEGESLIWVNVSALSGTDTKMIFWFGDPELEAGPSSRDAWCVANGSGHYGAVWHMAETIDAAAAPTTLSADSAKYEADRDMDAEPAKNSLGNLASMISCDGVVGNGRVNSDKDYSNTAYGVGLNAAPCYGDKIDGNNALTVSGWFFLTEKNHNYYFVQELNSFLIQKGAGCDVVVDCSWKSGIASDGKITFNNVLPDTPQWFHFVVTFLGKEVNIFTNGVLVGSGTLGGALAPAYPTTKTRGLGATIGNGRGAGHYPLTGAYDEVRLLSNVASEDWVKAEYETATQDDYLTYGAASKTTGDDSLVITATPQQLAGDLISPTYGTITSFDAPIDLVAPTEDIVISDILHVAFRGWELQRADADGNWYTVDSGNTNSYRYVHENGCNDKFIWKIVRRHPISLSALPSGSGSFLVDEIPVNEGVIWVDEDHGPVAVAPVAASGYDFIFWGGQFYGSTSATIEISVLPGEVVPVSAYFLSNGEGHEPTNVWWTAASGNWFDGANWSGGAAPQYGDTVYLTNCVATSKITVDAPLPHFARLVIGNPLQTVNQSTTLETRNWMTCIDADEIVVQSRGVITCASAFSNNEMSNRVWLVGRDLTVANGGKIDVDAKGYRGANGPAWRGAAVSSAYASSVYGGVYGGYPITPEPQPYGSAEEPLDPGSGAGSSGGNGGSGGGAVRLDFSGNVVVDGTISARSTSTEHNAYGSGGGVYVTCRTISGSGTVDASGGNFSAASRINCGGGGRIAVHYDAASQLNVTCTVAFYAAGGVGYDFFYPTLPVAETAPVETAYPRGGEDGLMINNPGTLWFTDNQFLDSPAYRAAGLPFGGRWMSAETQDELVFETDQTLRCSQLLLTMAVRAEGDVILQAPGQYFASVNSGLIVEGAGMTVKGNLTLEGARLELRGGKLTVKGDLEQLTNDMSEKTRFCGGTLALKAAPTNAPNAFGVELQVDGNWHIAANAVAYPYCEPTNGAIPKLVAHSLTVDEGGRIDADLHGWRREKGPGCSQSQFMVGSSHGGRGGTGTEGYLQYGMEPYGNRRMPLEPGSGGKSNAAYAGFDGGGVVYLNVEDVLTLNGTISADGNTKIVGTSAGAPSGGSIFINAFQFTGVTGLLRARGGFSSRTSGCTGGGGRIAVRTGVTDWTEAMWQERVNVRAGEVCADPGNTSYAEDGTFFWKAIGGLLLMVR